LNLAIIKQAVFQVVWLALLLTLRFLKGICKVKGFLIKVRADTWGCPLRIIEGGNKDGGKPRRPIQWISDTNIAFLNGLKFWFMFLMVCCY
jgi:hypothetical protein